MRKIEKLLQEIKGDMQETYRKDVRTIKDRCRANAGKKFGRMQETCQTKLRNI